MGSSVKYKHLSVLIENLSTDLLTTDKQFDTLKDEWEKLFAACKDEYHVFLSYAWNHTWWKHFSRDYKLAIVTVREKGELIGICPFMVKRHFGVCKIEPIGNDKFSYFGLLVSNRREDAIEAMAVRLMQSFPKGIIHFPYYTPENYTINVLAASLWSLGWHEARWVRNISPFVYEEDGFNRYLSKKSGNMRYNVQRIEKRIAKSGEVTVSHFAHSDLNDSIVDRIAEIQRKSWLIRRGIERLENPFYKEVLPLLALEGCAELFILSLNGDDLAFILNFYSNKCNHLVTLGFDEKRKDITPGNVLMKHSIQHILDRGDRFYDFLFGGGGYKDSWGNRTKLIFRCVFYRGFQGWALSWTPRLHGILAKYAGLRHVLTRLKLSLGKYSLVRKILWKTKIIRYGQKPE